MTGHTCRGQGTTWESQFSLSTLWELRIKLRLPVLVASIVTCWAILLACRGFVVVVVCLFLCFSKIFYFVNISILPACMYMYVCMYMYHMSAVPVEPKEGIGSLDLEL